MQTDENDLLSSAYSELPQAVERYIALNGLLPEDASVLVGLSGGADSVALLKLLRRLAPQHGWSIAAAHFNHGIRGVGAEADEQFCRELCEFEGVTLYCETEDIPAYARANGLSIESAGRLRRYEFLERIRAAQGLDFIAVAHHMDDNAESVLLHLFRGSGLLGLTGIQPKRGSIVRPLLNVRRQQIEAYLEAEGCVWCTDETNLLPDGTRNRLRLEVMPYLEQHINSALVPTLCSTAELLLQDEAYLAGLAMDALEKARREDGFERELLDGLPRPIKARALRLALAEAGAEVDIERVHVEALMELLHGRTGARLTLPHIEAYNSYSLIKFGKGEDGVEFETELAIGGVTETPLGSFVTEALSGTEGFYKSRGVGFLDMDELTLPLMARTRREGDRFRPVGAPGRRKLKEFYIDKKVERRVRDMTPLIAFEDEVMFIPGFGAAETAKVTDKTARMLKIEFIPAGAESGDKEQKSLRKND